jgi:hypothetical protein
MVDRAVHKRTHHSLAREDAAANRKLAARLEQEILARLHVPKDNVGVDLYRLVQYELIPWAAH